MTAEFRLREDLAAEMVEHCMQGRPNEACGILAVDGGAIVKVFRMTNSAASPVLYGLDPREQFNVYRVIEDQGWELGGVYHSHTRTEAYPSPTDVLRASEDVPYVIVSLAAEPPSIRAFRMIKDNWTDATGDIIELSVVIEPRDG